MGGIVLHAHDTPFHRAIRARRLRITGWVLLAAGLAGGTATLWIETHNAEQVLDDTNALGYTRSMQHGMGVMMGPIGSILTDWQTMLTSPTGQALIVVACAALLAAYFFRVAWVVDQEAQDRRD